MNIKAYREAHGLSQEQLAKMLGITQGAVYQWEAGLTHPSGRTASRIVRLTNGQVTLDDLFPPDENGSPPETAKEAA